MGGPFDWGGASKTMGYGKTDGAGVSQTLPRKVERMNMGERPPKMKQSGDGNNLPWGGQPKEQAKAYQSGLPKNNGSMLSKLGERGGKLSNAKGTKEMPRQAGKAHQGHKVTIHSTRQGFGKKGK